MNKHKGVNFYKSLNKWRAYICNSHLGYFDNIEDAIKARKKAEADQIKKTRRNSKLTESQVRLIKNSNDQAKVHAIDFGIAVSMVYGIRNNKYWKHI